MSLVEFSPQRLREAGEDPVSVIDRWRSQGLVPRGDGVDLPELPEELVLAVDAADPPTVNLRLERVDPPPPTRERLLSRRTRLGRTWARRFPPVEPGTLAYDATHRALVGSVIDDADWQRLFADDADLPEGLGVGFDERVVEYPWLFSRGIRGKVLDAGSVLNHRHVLERMLPAVEDLTIATLAPEPLAFTELGVSYLYADLRELPFRDDWFDEIVCLSTLEHIGMDNSTYGADAPRAENPSAEASRALGELLRVVRPGGRVHLSVPFGRREDHGWFRQLDRADVDALFDGAGVRPLAERCFLYGSRGWGGADSAAADATYVAAPGHEDDLAVAARAVLCATIQAGPRRP
jgi:SAM-dependent methyltransferase